MVSDDKKASLEYAQKTVRVFKVIIHALHDHAQQHTPFTCMYNVEAYDDQEAVETARQHAALSHRPIIFYEVSLICEIDVTAPGVLHE